MISDVTDYVCRQFWLRWAPHFCLVTAWLPMKRYIIRARYMFHIIISYAPIFMWSSHLRSYYSNITFVCLWISRLPLLPSGQSLQHWMRVQLLHRQSSKTFVLYPNVVSNARHATPYPQRGRCDMPLPPSIPWHLISSSAHPKHARAAHLSQNCLHT